MTDPRRADRTPLNPPGPEGPELLTQLSGEEAHEDQDAVLDASEVEQRADESDTEIYQGALEAAGAQVADDDLVSLEGLTSLDLRSGETFDPNVAAEEGEAWVPPVDPPVVADADAPGGMTIAAGFGATATDEPFDADHHSSLLPADDEVTARVREALLADARTSRLAEWVRVDTEAGVVTLRGVVDDIDDSDLLAEVAGAVTGVTEVVDETEVEGL